MKKTAGIMSVLWVVLFVTGCHGTHPDHGEESPATVMQKHLIASGNDNEALTWYGALKLTDVTEDPHIWVAAAMDGSHTDLVRMLSFHALARRFFTKGADIRDLSLRLGIESWWSPAYLAPDWGGENSSLKVPKQGQGFEMKVPGDPLKDPGTAEQRVLRLAIAPKGSVADIYAAAKGQKGAHAYRLEDLSLPVDFGPSLTEEPDGDTK